MPAQGSDSSEKHGVYFHVYNKGAENQILFKDKKDYNVFFGYLRDYLSPPPDPEKTKKQFSVKGRTFHGIPHQPKNYFGELELVSYSLLPNHFHLLIKEIKPGALEKLFRSISTRYAIYFNKKHSHQGSIFAGPYRSVKISDARLLILLTRFFHREPIGTDGFSSYEDYLGMRQNSWMNTKTILSYFEGISAFKSFNEHYQLKDSETKALEDITLENKLPPVEYIKKEGVAPPKQSQVASETKPTVPPVHKKRSRAPEFASISVGLFILLFVLGFNNVKGSIAQTNSVISTAATPAPQIAGSETFITATPVPTVYPSVTPIVTGTENEVQIPEPTSTLTIVITDGSNSVNVRSEPNIGSGVLKKAVDGETYVLASPDKVAGWYQIALEDGMTAYVSAKYAQIEGEKED